MKVAGKLKNRNTANQQGVQFKMKYLSGRLNPGGGLKLEQQIFFQGFPKAERFP